MGCNNPRPWKRPPTPQEKAIMEQAVNEPLTSLDRIRKGLGLDPIGDLMPPKSVRINSCVSKPKKTTRTNCPNCCAVITGPICEYCGTRFPEFEQRYSIYKTTENQEIVIPIYIGNERIDEVKTIKIPTKEEF